MQYHVLNRDERPKHNLWADRLQGVTFFDSAEAYEPFTNEELLGKVPPTEITTEGGILLHKGSGKKAAYGEMASIAAKLPVPKDVPLKKVRDFKVIGNSKKNVEDR